MSSVVNPVGPEDPSIYWRRRAVVGVALLFLVWLAWLVVSTLIGGSGEAAASAPSHTPSFGLPLNESAESSDDESDPSASGTETETDEATDEASDGPTDEPGAGDTATGASDAAAIGLGATGATGATGPSGASGPTDASAKDSASPSASDSLSASPSEAATGTCDTSAIKVSVTPGAESVTSGTGTSLTMAVQTTGTEGCTQDVGSGANEIKVLSASGKVVYSSDDCNPSKATKDVALIPGSPWTATVTWDGRSSVAGCASGGAALPPGTYTVVARNGSLTSDPVTVTVQ